MAMNALLLVGCGSDDSGTPALSSDATLADLSISAENFDQIFQSNQTDYTATVSLLKSTTTVTAMTAHPNASVLVNGILVDSATKSGKFTLNHGGNAITVVVTAEDGVTTDTYSIEITRQTVASFAQQAYIKASNTNGVLLPCCDDIGDQFGIATALDGNTLAVGAIGEDSASAGINGDQNDNSSIGSGAVYVFVRDDSGLWRQQAYIKAAHPDGNIISGLTESRLGDNFGASVALYGDTLAVGAPGEDGGVGGIGGDESDNSALDSGAVYVFTRSGDDWTQQTYIKTPNPIGGEFFFDDAPYVSGGEEFGTAVTLLEDTLVIIRKYRSGSAFIYERDEDNQWTLATEFEGAPIAINENTLVVAKSYEDHSTYDDIVRAGAVYVYNRLGSGEWQQQARLESPDGIPRANPYSEFRYGDQFGAALSLDGNSLAIGAIGEDSVAAGIDGDKSDNSLSGSGAVYVFVRDDHNTWTSQAYIKASTPGEGAGFGHRLALKGDLLVVGVPREDGGGSGINGDQTNVLGSSGATYLFTRDADGLWSQQVYIKASYPNYSDFFGNSVVLDSDTLVISASHEDSDSIGFEGDQSDNSAENSGAIYVFK